MINTGAALAVESGADLSFFAWSDGALGLFGDGAAAAGLDVTDDQWGGADVPETEGDVELFPFDNCAIVPRERIQPGDRRIMRGVGHDLADVCRLVVMTGQGQDGDQGEHGSSEKWAHKGRYFLQTY